MSGKANMSSGLDDLGGALSGLIEAQRLIAGGLFKLAARSGDMLARVARDRDGEDDCCARPKMGIPQITGSCCDIPEPCWMPRCLGEFDCRLCPGSSATLRMRVTNDDLRGRPIHAMASGPAAAQVSFAPPSLMLGPKERGAIVAALSVPATAATGETFEALVWLRGCRDYYARLTATVGPPGECCTHELSICDGPDHILHWYDHFYCPRPCRNSDRQPG